MKLQLAAIVVKCYHRLPRALLSASYYVTPHLGPLTSWQNSPDQVIPTKASKRLRPSRIKKRDHGVLPKELFPAKSTAPLAYSHTMTLWSQVAPFSGAFATTVALLDS